MSKEKKALDFAAGKLGVKLKEKQSEAVLAFLSGHDVFVSLPTGYGKSLIYGILPIVFDNLNGKPGSIVVCVSPLTSLMIDQKDKFTPCGISAEFVGEAQTDRGAVNQVMKGNCQLVFISPECIVCNPAYRNMLLSPVYKERLVAFVIDEVHCVKSWGDDFRTAFAHLGEIRSIIPSSVNVLALTASATNSTFAVACQRLSMLKPILIGLPPYRQNIKFTVKARPKMSEFCNNVAEEVKSQGLEYPKTIIFCRTYHDCGDLYYSLHKSLGAYFTFPPNYPDFHQFRIVEMFTRASTTDMKEKVLHSLCASDGKLRIVVGTTAFGMGIDCHDIRKVIHWGPPTSLEQYVQESGRAGRDSLPSSMLYSHGKHVDEDVKEYAKNEEKCRRELLYKNFLFSFNRIPVVGCKCCDICANSCLCIECSK